MLGRLIEWSVRNVFLVLVMVLVLKPSVLMGQHVSERA